MTARAKVGAKWSVTHFSRLGYAGSNGLVFPAVADRGVVAADQAVDETGDDLELVLEDGQPPGVVVHVLQQLPVHGSTPVGMPARALAVICCSAAAAAAAIASRPGRGTRAGCAPAPV